MLELPDGAAALVIIHPHSSGRQDAADKQREYARFVADLRWLKILAKRSGSQGRGLIRSGHPGAPPTG
jgi:hypothetical protein